MITASGALTATSVRSEGVAAWWLQGPPQPIAGERSGNPVAGTRFLLERLLGIWNAACRRDGKCSGSTVAKTRDLMESDLPVPHMDSHYPAESVPEGYAEFLRIEKGQLGTSRLGRRLVISDLRLVVLHSRTRAW